MPEASVLDKIVSANEANLYFKHAYYGSPGSGKTCLASHAPGALLIDTEHGALSLRNHPELANVRVFPVGEFDDLTRIFWELKDDTKYPEIETIIIDSFSELQKRAMDEDLKKSSVIDRKKDPYLPIGKDYQKTQSSCVDS